MTLDYGKNGQVTRKRVDRRNKLRAIETLLKAHDKETYGDKRTVALEGNIDHRHAHAHLIGNAPDNSGGYRVSYEALAALPEDKRVALLMLLEEVEQIRLEQKQRPALPGQNGDTQ